MTAFML